MEIFENLLIKKIDTFIEQFKDSKILFYDQEKGQLIQPGEYGIFREKICKEFLRSFVPTRLSFGTGFLINAFNEVSTQCDIIIYDSQNTPIIQNDELQTFYPVESVAAIGEIKSKLSKSDFFKALLTLAKNKKMRADIKAPSIVYQQIPNLPYSPMTNPYDQIFTFLICEKFEFDYTNIVYDLNSIYEGVPQYLKHNLVLSIDDGLLCYHDQTRNKTTMYPIFPGSVVKNRMVISDGNNPYPYMKFFSSYMFQGTSAATIFFPEITSYMGSLSGGRNITEKDGLTDIQSK